MSAPLPAYRRRAELLELILVSPTTTETDVKELCDAAEELRITRVCVNSLWIDALRRRVSGTKIIPAATVGYPQGTMTMHAAAQEAKCAVEHGAQAITMMMHQGLACAQRWIETGDYINAVATAVGTVPLTVIIHPASLETDFRIKEACRRASLSGAACVAALSHCSVCGADMRDLRLMERSLRNTNVGLMVFGGVTPQNIDARIEIGVTRIGTDRAMATKLLACNNGSSSNDGLGY